MKDRQHNREKLERKAFNRDKCTWRSTADRKLGRKNKAINQAPFEDIF